MAMIFLPDFLYNSFLFLNFAHKYRRYVVKTALAHGAWFPWAQGGGATLVEQIIASAIYSEYHET